jgi:hypothetical protein
MNMKMKLVAWTGTLVLALNASLLAADTVKYDAQPTGSEMKIDGTSTIHDWYCKSGIISGGFEAEQAWQKDVSLKSVTSLGPGKAPVCKVSIPVRTLKSSSGRIMDGIMIDAMKGKEFTSIDYKLTEMVIKGEVPATGSPVTFDCKGELTVSGTTNKVSFPVKMERVGDDKLKFSGTTKVKMTDYGIKPPAPSIGLGMIKTGDEVTLTWTWMTAVKKD